MMLKISEYQKIYKIAFLVAVSSVLQICESLIPHPIPGLRLGLANIMTLVALVTLGFGPALEVSILRTLLSSLLMGTFMSPAFILSFSGALTSTLLMGLLYWISNSQKYLRLSIVGISILSALAHNLVQLYLAYLILIRHKGIFIFLPWLGIGAVVTGWITGIVAGNLCRKLQEAKESPPAKEEVPLGYSCWERQDYVAGDSFFHRLSPEIKIISVFILSLILLIFSNPWVFLWVTVFLVIVAGVSQVPFDFLFLKMKKSTSLVFVSFLFPLFFNSGGNLKGLNLGCIFALRIILLIILSSLLVRLISPKDLTRGLSGVLSPLRFLGLSQERFAAILSLSWMAVPVFWEIAKKTIRVAELERAKKIRQIIPFLTDTIAAFYLETAQVCAAWENENIINQGILKIGGEKG